MKSLLRVSIIVPAMSLIIGISTPSMAFEFVPSGEVATQSSAMATSLKVTVTGAGGFTLGSDPSDNPGAGLTLGFHTTSTYNFDIPDPTVSVDPVSVPQGATSFSVTPSLDVQSPTLTYNTDYNFDTDLWARWNGIKIAGITIIPKLYGSFSIPNFSVENLSFTTKGSGTLSASSSVSRTYNSPYSLGGSFDSKSGSLWQVQGDAVSMLAGLDIPYVSQFASALDEIGFYVDPGLGLGADAEGYWGVSFQNNFESNLFGGGACSAIAFTSQLQTTPSEHIHTPITDTPVSL